LFGIPFEGIDYIYENNPSRTKGVVGKFFTIFDVTGKKLTKVL
jgi:hypothetical protein